MNFCLLVLQVYLSQKKQGENLDSHKVPPKHHTYWLSTYDIPQSSWFNQLEKGT